MGASDPARAILDQLAGPVGVWESGATTSCGIASGIVRGGNPEGADLKTVRLVKHRESERRHPFFVTFQATIPRLGRERLSCDYVYPVERDLGGGWRVLMSEQRSSGWTHRPVLSVLGRR